MKMMKNMERLLEIAESDENYQTWKKTYHGSAAEFETFANEQPEQTRKMLWAYAESGRLMYQRLMNLACEEMRFLD